MGTGSFPGGKERSGRDPDPSPPSSAVGHERVELYLLSPYGPYGLYRASVPVQGWPLLFTHIRNDTRNCSILLQCGAPNILWYVYLRICVRRSNPGGGEIFRTCQDRPWGPPSLLCNGYPVFPGGKERPGRYADPSPPSSAVGHKRGIPLLPLWAVRPVQSLSACTRVTFTFSGTHKEHQLYVRYYVIYVR